MLQALLAGVASIKAQQTRMNVIGNNLANVNTTAFKGSRVTFQDMIAQTIRGATSPRAVVGGTNPIQYGLGVLVAGTDTNNEQGSLNATNRPGDLAIQGNGYFCLSDGGGMVYTRDGAFDLDANGDLVQRSTGQRVLGWTADENGTVDVSSPIGINSSMNIPLGKLSTSQVTTRVEYAGNLNSAASPTDSWSSTVRVFDALGGPHDVTIEFRNHTVGTDLDGVVGATSSWEWEASENGTPIASSAAPNAKLYFDTEGQLLNPTATQTVTVPASGSAAAFNLNLDFRSVSQLNTDTQVQASNQNGFPPGSLQGYSIGNDGTITGIFTNGLTQPIGRIALSIFPNPGALERLGNNLWRATDNSGIAVIGEPRTGGRGTINAGFLEQSNVDIGAEFTDLIVTQRGFQANTRVVTTVDEMLQDLLNMKR